MIPYWRFPTNTEWIYVLIVGIAGFFAQVFTTKAFQVEEVRIIAPMKYLEVLYALLIGWIWFGEVYTLLSFVGILLIVLGMFLNLLKK